MVDFSGKCRERKRKLKVTYPAIPSRGRRKVLRDDVEKLTAHDLNLYLGHVLDSGGQHSHL